MKRRETKAGGCRSDFPDWTPLALLLFLTFAVYARSLFADLVYDARAQVLIDRYIHDPRHLLDVLTMRVLGMDVLDFNRPVHLFSMMIDATFWAERPFGYHLTSVLLHVLVVAGAYRLALRFNASRFGAFAGALIFAVHPLNCEAVAEPSYREDLLVAFFSVGAMLLTARLSDGRFRLRWSPATLLIPCCCFLAVGAKESGVIAPLLVFATGWLVPTKATGGVPVETQGARRRFWIVLGLSAGVVGAFLWARFAMEPANSVIFQQRPQAIAASLSAIFLIQVRIWTFYLSSFLWPSRLCADYGPISIAWITVGWGIAAVSATVLLQAVGSYWRRLILLGAVVFWGALLPVSNFVPIFRPMADRFMYFPMIGMALMVAALVDLPRVGRALGILLCVATVPLGAVTLVRQDVWNNSVALWRDTLAENPTSFDAMNNLAGALAASGKAQEAIPLAEQAVALSNGKVAEAYATLAFAQALAGNESVARRTYARASALDPLYARPEQLVSALRWERKDAEVLQRLANNLDTAR